jgi:conjugal transfer ATP-binding protein TraC
VYAQNGRDACIEDVRQWLLGHQDPRAQDLGTLLWTFGKEGPYHTLFNRPATINLSHAFVVIETQNLKDDLKTVVIQLMMVQAWQRMVRSDRQTPFVILIDEAWELIQGPSSGKFVEAMVRTTRKYRASLILATQNLMDYFRPESPGATVAFQNAEWKCILHQDPATTAAMGDHPFLKELVSTPFREGLLRSLLPAQGFSEIFFYGKAAPGIVGRLYVDPFTALLYSSNPQDFFEVQGYVKQGYPIAEAVQAVLKKRGIAC